MTARPVLSHLWLIVTVLVGLALVPVLFDLPLASADDPPASAATAEPKEQLPPGVTPATLHPTIVVPAGPEDPSAPAPTYSDPVGAPEGDESADRAIPDYLKGNPYRLSFVSGDYVPPVGVKVDKRLLEGLGRSARGYTYGYVMFEGAIQARKREALEDIGLAFGNRHTFNCMEAWIPANAIDALRVSPFVRWVGYAQPEQKVDEFILAKLMEPGADPTEELAIFVNVFDSDLGPLSRPRPIDRVLPQVPLSPREIEMQATVMMSNGPLQAALEDARVRVIGYEDSIRTFYVWATRPAIRRLMALDFVSAMDTAFPPTPDLDRSLRQTASNYPGSLTSYNGKDTSIAIVDSGVYHSHRDHSQTYAIGWDYSGEGSSGRDDCGHGTHVASIAIGDGTARSDGRYRGSAPKTGTIAEHAVYRVKLFKANCGGGPGWPNYAPTAWGRTTLGYSVFSTMTNKSTVSQNSWGNGPRLTSGYYGTDTLSRALDTNVHTYRQLYVNSSGNDGGNSTTQYLKSCRPPGVAKNALTVGSVNDWDDTSGLYGARYPGAHRYSSSKGSTRDGRIKPQVSAPGTWIVAAKTNTTTGYTAKSGTSMAAPHVSGIAAMMHDGSSIYRIYPCLCRAKIMAASAPYAGTRSWSTSSESYYNRRGMGQADAYATIFSRNSPGGWTSGYAYRTLTRSSAGFSFDITVPSDATRTFFVMSWDEKPAALNATKAVLYNLDLVLDVAPFDPDINKGEYVSRRIGDNYDWYGNIGSISQLRGKTVRVKIPFLTKPTSSSEVVRVGVGYHIPRGDATPSTTLSLIASPSIVKPGAAVTVTGTPTVAAYRANNLYLRLDSTGGMIVDTLSHETRDNRTLDTNSVVTGSLDSKLNWTLGAVGSNWSPAHCELTWKMRAPSTNGSKLVRASLHSDTSTGDTDSVTICVDGQSPNAPGSLKSTTHSPNVWTNQRAFTAVWSAASDVGCAGVNGYGYRFASSSIPATSRNLGLVTAYSTTFPTSAGARWYYNLRAFDRATNMSSNRSVGPFLIDTVAPTSGRISINGGAATTGSLIVTLTGLGATDTGSGVRRMRFSNSGTTWSGWQTFATTRTGWNMAAYGGNTSPGTKRVYVQYDDTAGNTSSRYSDTIVYAPLVISTVTPNRGTLIGDDLVTITGQGFRSGMQVWFATSLAKSVVVSSSTRLTCRTPTRLTGGTVDVRVQIGSLSAVLARVYTYVGASIQATGDPRLGVAFPILFNAAVDGGRQYVGAASFGTGPILLDPHNPLRLTPDELFLLTVANRIPFMFGGLRGTLNSSGQAKGTVLLPKIPGLVGLRFRMAFVTLDPKKPLGIRTVSTTRTFRIQP